MKILAVCQYYDPEPFVISRLLEQLVSFGHEVHVITGFPNYGYGRIMDGYEGKKQLDEIIRGVHVHRVKIVPRKDSRISICRNYLSFYFHAKKYVKKLDGSFDLVFSMVLSPVIAAVPANWYSKKHHVPHLLYSVDLWPESLVMTGAVRPHSPAYAFFYHWSKKTYQGTHRILCSSPSHIAYFQQVLHMKDHSYGVLMQPCLAHEEEYPAVSYAAGTFNIVYCGNMGKLQLLPFLYEAMSQLQQYPEIYFHMIGMGSEKKAFFAEVEKRGLEKQILDHGALPAKKAAAYFKNADALYVSLSNKGYVGKTIPNKLIFYLSFGKPILAMVDHDARDVLKEAGGALLIEESSDALKAAILTLKAMHVEERDALGRKNLRYYQSNLSFPVISKKLEEEMLSLKKAAMRFPTEEKE